MIIPLLFYIGRCTDISLPKIVGNLTVNFGALKISHSQNFVQVPASSQKMRLSFTNLHAMKSFNHFISLDSLYSKAYLKISNSIFSDYSKAPIYISSANTNGEKLANQGFNNINAPNSFYDRENCAFLEVKYCSFKKCTAKVSFNDFISEGYSGKTCGGALYASGSVKVSIETTFFEECAASSQGGSLFFMNIQNEVSISECHFFSSKALYGTAICLDNTCAKIKNCIFSSSASSLNDGKATTGTIQSTGESATLSVESCSFIGSGLTGSFPTAYADVFCQRRGIRKAKVYVGNICVSVGNPMFKVSDSNYLAVIIYNTEKNLHEIKNIGIEKGSNIEEYLISYTDKSHDLKKSTLGNELCRMVHRTPGLTPKQTIPHRTPFSTPDLTSKNSIPRTPSLTQNRTQDTTEDNNNSITEDNENNDTIILITIIFAVIFGLVIVIIIVYFSIKEITKDRRTAFNGEDQTSSELAYPEIEELESD